MYLGFRARSALTFVLLFPTCALAEEPTLEGRGYLGMEAQLLSYGSGTLKATGSDIDISRTAVGVGNPAFGLGLGFAPAESLVIGTRLMVFNEKLDTGPDSVSQTGFMFLLVRGLGKSNHDSASN